MKYDPEHVTWRDTSDITMIACMIEEGIENVEEKYNFFLKAEQNSQSTDEDNSYMLDNETMLDALKSAEEDSVFIEVYQEQINRWKNSGLTTIQENKINRMSEELGKYSDLHQKYFELIKKLADEVAVKNMDIQAEGFDIERLTDELPKT